MSIAEKLTTIAENEAKVYDAGKQAEYDTFWDAFQQNGNRVDYQYAFYGTGWNLTNYKPKYPLVPTRAEYMYRLTTIEEVGSVDISRSGNISYMFGASKNVKKIERLIVSTAITRCDNAFYTCNALENITFEGVWGCNSLSLQWSPLTRDSLLSLINVLEDKSTDTSGTEWEITIGDTNIAKLTETELDIAHNKGWVIY